MKTLHTLLLSVSAAMALFTACAHPQSLRWSKSPEGGMTLCSADETVGTVKATVPGGVKATYGTQKVDDCTWKVTCTFEACQEIPDARLLVDFVIPHKSSWWMIPSVSYNGNDWGRGQEPKGASLDGEWRTYSYRKTPVPGAVYSENDSYAIATWSDVPARAEDDFSCSAMPQETETVHRLIWPEEEMPVCYCGRDRYKEGFRRGASMAAGEKRTMALYVSVTPTEPDHRAIRHFLTTCWNSSQKPELPVADVDTVWNRGVHYFKNSLWAEEGSYTGFSIGLLPSGDGWNQRNRGKYESGWCGQNISIATSMLVDYQKTGDRESLDKGMKTLDCWARNARLDNGLFLVHYDDVLTPKPDRIIDACNLGTTALNYIEAYNVAKECGFERPEYLDIAFKACDFALNDQREDGCYARGWNLEGECYVREGTVGCFMVPAMIAAWKQSGEDRYLESARKGYDFYLGQLLRDGYTTAGALDTWCIDKESSVTLLRSSIRLYEITGEDRYLSEAEQVSFYLSTWLWHYDGAYPQDDNFTVYDWHTFGATSVSVQHNHLDYYAAYWVPEWIRLSELTGDPQWSEKALAVWRNSCQLISDGTLEINGRVRPRGSQNEAYFECCWGFDDYPGRINNWLVSWPGAFRLETIRHADCVLK